MNIEIANRLVKMRKAHGYSQEELAEKLGISRQAVSKWERAESSPDTDNLIMLSRLYGVKLDELLATEDEIPMPEPEPEVIVGSKPKDSVHLSWKEGINVTDEDGSSVHVGWDGIRVNDKKTGEKVNVGGGDFDSGFIGGAINDIEVDDNGVTFTENGERVHHDWNSTKNGKRRFVHKVRDEKSGKWRTTVVTEDGHKVVLDTAEEIDEGEIMDDGHICAKSKKHGGLGFPYAVLVTGAFLLLGFLKNWWHPAWLLFLTIPIYYTVESMFINGIRGRSAVTGVYSLVVTAAYITLGFVFGTKAWAVGWLLFLTIPMFGSIVKSISKKRGRRWVTKFPWEILIVTAYLFVGLMYGVWHPTWVVFLLIPVWRWLVSLIGDKKKSTVSGSFEIDGDDDDDDDDD